MKSNEHIEINIFLNGLLEKTLNHRSELDKKDIIYLVEHWLDDITKNTKGESNL